MRRAEGLAAVSSGEMPAAVGPGLLRAGEDGFASVAIEAAERLHGPSSVEAKVAWVTAAALRLCQAQFAVYFELERGVPRMLASSGNAPAYLDDLVSTWASRVVGLPPSDSVRPELQSSLAAPVRGPSNRLYGGLIVGHEGRESFSDTQRLALDALAANLAVALDNLAAMTQLAELEASRREASHQLQYAVLPPVPSLAGTELGRHYVPADPTSPTGGDLYDWTVLPDGDLHIAVVDVAGKGVAATKDALSITHALRLLVLSGCPLVDLVRRAHELVIATNPDLVATLMVARFAPATGELRLVGAGHPPALIVRERGEIVQLEAPGIPIGWDGAGSTTVAAAHLERSDTVVLYTDGLIESTKDILDGLGTLVQAVTETATYPAPQMARALVERALADAERRDDSLAVVLRRRMPPARGAQRRLGPFEHRFSPSVAAVPVARHLLQDWLDRQPIEPGEVGDLLLVASELYSNAIKASSGVPGSLVLRAWTEGDAVCLEMEDDGPGFDWPGFEEDDMPAPGLEQGRGLFIVKILTDEASVERRNGCTFVRCVKRAAVGGRSA